jgi:hypothetical protein
MTTASKRLHLRFSLRTLLVLFLGLSIGCALLFPTPVPIAIPLLVLLTVTLPAVLTAGTIYTRGNLRAFCVGGLFPSGLALYTTGWLFGLSLLEGPGRVNDPSEWISFFDDVGPQYRVYSACSWVMIALVGAIVVFVRYLALKGTEEASLPRS